MKKLSYHGKEIHRVEFSNHTPEEHKEISDKIVEEIRKLPEKSVLMLTVMAEGFRFNSSVQEIQKEYSRNLTPYLKRSAMVGASGLIKVLLAGVRIALGREIRTFNTEKEAMDWLISEEL